MPVSIRKFSHLLAICTACLMLATGVSSCGSSRQVASASTTTSHGKSKSTRKAPERHSKQPRAHISTDNPALNPVTLQLLKEADEWLGTPYAWGGNDRKGVDCSGFVTQVYLRSLEISLPRTSERQMQYCVPIEKKDLIPGDLVFFTVRGGDRVGHVGIYIGNGEMVHASSSKGVVVTPLSNPYFVANYYSSGRVERYIALLDSKSKKSKPAKTETPAKPQQPLLAKASSPAKPSQPTSAKQEKTTPKQTKAATPEKRKVKPIPATTEPKNEYSTPMPSQVFASKERVTTPPTPSPVQPSTTPLSERDDDETDSEFFD